MEHHLDYKVTLGTEPEHKNLYKWFLSESGENVSKYNRDQIPWAWTLYFAVTELTLVTGTEAECEHDSDTSKITSKEHIVARMEPGLIRDGRLQRENSYSMFGTNRRIKTFDLQIRPASDEESQGCSAWGCVSYTAELDFRMDTQPDMVSFYLTVSQERFDRYVQQIRENSLTSALFRVGRVAGFYSGWSPSISTSNIKVLTSDHKDHPVEIPSGCEIVPPRLGFVGEAELLLYTERKFNLPPLEDFDDDKDEDTVSAVLEEKSNPDLQLQALLVQELRRTNRFLKTMLWIIGIFAVLFYSL